MGSRGRLSPAGAVLLVLASLSTAPGAVATPPPVSGAIDFQTTVELGYNSPYANVVAPFNVTAPSPLSGALNFIEIRSENNLWIDVTVYAHDDYSSVNASANQGKELVKATHVTYFLISFGGPSVEVAPANNVTAPAEVAQRFARLSGAPGDNDYMIIVERRDTAATNVNFTLDRLGSPIGSGAPGAFGPAATAAIALGALALGARRRNRWG
jgi:hypothetical protein